MNHGLSAKELLTIKTILSTYSECIDGVGVFGSRANGEYKDYSDIDLVVYGDIAGWQIDRLNTLFDESSIGLSVDIKSYNHIADSPLKKNIDTAVKMLLTKEELNGEN